LIFSKNVKIIKMVITETNLIPRTISSVDELLARHELARNENKRPKITPIFIDKWSSPEIFTNPFHLSPQDIDQLIFYNPSKPIESSKGKLIAIRVEPRQSEFSRVFFLAQKKGEYIWHPLKQLPSIELQDPFFLGKIEGKRIFGGVKIWQDEEEPGRIAYRTCLWRLEDILGAIDLPTATFKEPFFEGPKYMKGIRLLELAPGRIAVFTRPQGERGGRGQIAYTEISSLSQLTPEVTANAPIVEGLFRPEEWGGVNDLFLLEDGRIGVIGHIAREKEGLKDYYPISFIFDPKTFKFSDLKILVSEKDYLGPDYVSKNPSNLRYILYPGGYLPPAAGEKRGKLYAGLGDFKAVEISLPHPFQEE